MESPQSFNFIEKKPKSVFRSKHDLPEYNSIPKHYIIIGRCTAHSHGRIVLQTFKVPHESSSGRCRHFDITIITTITSLFKFINFLLLKLIQLLFFLSRFSI